MSNGISHSVAMDQRTPPVPANALRIINLILKSLLVFYNVIGSLLKKTNVHGIRFVFDGKLHAVERIFWLTLIAGASYGAFSISSKQYERYDANPTVISLERDYRDWNGTLPAISVCYHKRVDEERAQKFIKRKWGIEKTDDSFPYFLDYVKAVVYVNESFTKFNKFVNDKRLEIVDMLEISREVHPVINSVISSFDTSAEFMLTEVITEKGICYTVNSILAPLISTT